MNGAGRELTSRGLAQRLSNYQIKSCNIRIGSIVLKGYKREDLNDAWTRYLGEPVAETQLGINTEEVIKEKGYERTPGVAPQEPATSATPLHHEACDGCGAPLWNPESQLLGKCARCRQDAA